MISLPIVAGAVALGLAVYAAVYMTGRALGWSL